MGTKGAAAPPGQRRGEKTLSEALTMPYAPPQRRRWVHHVRTAARWLGYALLVLLFCAASLFFPVLAAASATLFLCSVFKSRKVVAIGATLVVVGCLGWMNSNKFVSGDWGWYTLHYEWLEHMSLSRYLGHQFGVLKIKLTEPVYHTISWAVSRISGGNIPTLAWVVSCLVYVPLAWSIYSLYQKYAANNSSLALLIIIPLLTGVTFTLTTQLVRQEIASAFLVTALALWSLDRWRAGLALAVVAVLTHNSAAVPASVVIGTIVFLHFFRLRALLVLYVLLAGAAAAALGYYIINSGDAELFMRDKDDGQVSIYVYIMDASLAIAFMALGPQMSKMAHTYKIYRVLFVSLLIYAMFLVGVSPQPIPLLRMYFYVEGFRILIIGAILAYMLTRWQLRWMAYPGLLLALVYVDVRIMISPFHYGGGLIRHLLSPMMLFF